MVASRAARHGIGDGLVRSTSLSVLTITADRTDRLATMLAAIERSTRRPDEVVAVSMSADDDLAPLRERHPELRTERLLPRGDRLPLAAARNRAARLARGERLVFLDVDCAPTPTALDRLEQALARDDAVVMGGVGYLPEHAPPPTDPDAVAHLAAPHPARPHPPRGLTTAEDPDLFWSLSFGVRRATFLERIGGFDEGYRGYGGEDTDLGRRIAAAGVPMRWVGDAVVLHQWHPGARPPLQHVRAIVANARRFRERWGDWPMRGWLDAFDALGIVEFRPDADVLRYRREPTADELSQAFETGRRPVT